MSYIAIAFALLAASMLGLVMFLNFLTGRDDKREDDDGSY